MCRAAHQVVAVVGLALALSAALPAAAAPTTELAVSPQQSRVWLDGTTNVHSWRCSGDSMRGAATLTIPPARLAELLAAWQALPSGSPVEVPAGSDDGLAATFDLRIPIAALDCANRPMERDMRRALRAAEHPEIGYAFRRVRDARAAPAGSVPSFSLVVEGELTLAGQTRPVAIAVTATREANAYRLRGGMELRMSDFGIEPPVALLGLVRARDELWVSLDLLVTTKAAAPGPTAPGR